VKYLIILFFLILGLMILMVPVKLLTSVQSRCHRCGGSVFYSRRKKEFRCPHCGAEIIRNGLPVSPPQ